MVAQTWLMTYENKVLTIREQLIPSLPGCLLAPYMPGLIECIHKI